MEEQKIIGESIEEEGGSFGAEGDAQAQDVVKMRGRGKVSGEMSLPNGGAWQRDCPESIRKVFCLVRQGQVILSVNVRGYVYTQVYKAGEQGGATADGRNSGGAANWGSGIRVTIEAVGDSSFYYHVEWH